MIFITLGTQDKPFTRLLDAVEQAIKDGIITDNVIVQAGHTPYQSEYMEIFDLIPMDQFHDYMKQCDLLITHGGVGSIMNGLQCGKKVIASPRLKAYGEHTNDHQLQIISHFAESGYLVALEEMSQLGEALVSVNQLKPSKIKSNREKFTQLVSDYIDSIIV